MKQSLDQRRYNLNITRKQIYEECRARNIKISYNSVSDVIANKEGVSFHFIKLIDDLLTCLEGEQNIEF